MKGFRIVLPQEVRNKMMRQHHDSIFGCHMGKKTTNSKIAERYWWPNRKLDVNTYVSSCLEYQKRSTFDQVKVPLQPLPEVSWPFESVGLDIISFKENKGKYTSVFTMIDHFSRYLVMVPLENQTAETVAKIFIIEWVLRFG